MQFIHLTNKINEASNILLREACEQRNVSYVEVDPIDFSYVSPIKHQKGDLVYRSATGKKAKTIVQFLGQKEIITFHKSNHRIDVSYDALSVFRKNKVRQPKTIDWVPRSHKELEKAAMSLGGFPLIVKVMGGSHGVGVMKIDSLSSLLSISDYFRKKTDRVILREFIPGGTSARIIVLGDKVIDSIEYQAPKKDFRSNVGSNPIVKAKKFSKSIENLAIKAVQSMDLEFGGVDVLIHKGKGYVAESNYPCYFPRCSKQTGVDIAGKMVDHLLKKRKRVLKK